jgi:HSP20 family molecular chaperone IbpA
MAVAKRLKAVDMSGGNIHEVRKGGKIMFGSGVWRFGRLMDPYAEMSRLQGEMNRLFPGAAHPFAQSYPAVNIWTGEQEAIVTAELAGIDPGKLTISVLGDNLTLSGAQEPEVLQENETYHLRRNRSGQD